LIKNIENSSTKFSCKDPNGNPTDWFVILLFPNSTSGDDSINFGYFDENSKNLKYYGYKKGNFPPIDLTTEIPLDDSSSNYFVWNDDTQNDPPKRNLESDSGKAHSKGVLVYDQNGGYILIHSLPRFPLRNKKETEILYIFPNNVGAYAQSWLCINANKDSLIKIIDDLNIIVPELLLNVQVDNIDKPANPSVLKLIKNRFDSKGKQTDTMKFTSKKRERVYIILKIKNCRGSTLGLCNS